MVAGDVALEEKVLQASQRDRLAAGERLGMEDTGEVPPVARPVTDRVDDAGLARRLVLHQLRPIASQRRNLGVELVGDVEQQARALDDPQVDAEVVKDPRRVERHPGDVGLLELGPEPCVLDELSGGRVIGCASSQ